MEFYGIASESGINEINPSILTDFEGFKPDPKKIAVYAMEIFSAKEENKVLFLADLSVDDHKKIDDLISSGKNKEALIHLNNSSKSLSIMDAENAEEKWKKITS